VLRGSTNRKVWHLRFGKSFVFCAAAQVEAAEMIGQDAGRRVIISSRLVQFACCDDR
jgi:hypothetical protein